MANTKTAEREWLPHIQDDIQRKINMQRRQRNKKRNRSLQPPTYPSVKELYGAAIMIEEY